jgi:hypothetical protein
LFRQHLIGIQLQLRLAILGIYSGDRRLLRHRIAFESHFQVLLISLSSFDLKFSVSGLLFKLRV